MALGPGKYDDLCSYVLEKAEARGPAVLVFGGKHGAGFSVQADFKTVLKMPAILRYVADEIEKSQGSA